MTRLSDRGVSTFPRYQNIMLFVLYFALLMYSSNVHCIGTFNGQSGKSAYLSSVKTYTPGSCQIINHNFIAKITYGNRNKNGIEICHWNAGGGFLINKQAETRLGCFYVTAILSWGYGWGWHWGWGWLDSEVEMRLRWDWVEVYLKLS